MSSNYTKQLEVRMKRRAEMFETLFEEFRLLYEHDPEDKNRAAQASENIYRLIDVYVAYAEADALERGAGEVIAAMKEKVEEIKSNNVHLLSKKNATTSTRVVSGKIKVLSEIVDRFKV